MLQTTAHQIATLLIQTEQAHGQYERSVLHGIYDQDWANWYAQYAIDQGIEKLLDRPFSKEQLSQCLSQNYEQYKTEKSQLTWAAYTAQGLVLERQAI